MRGRAWALLLLVLSSHAIVSASTIHDFTETRNAVEKGMAQFISMQENDDQTSPPAIDHANATTDESFHEAFRNRNIMTIMWSSFALLYCIAAFTYDLYVSNRAESKRRESSQKVPAGDELDGATGDDADEALKVAVRHAYADGRNLWTDRIFLIILAVVSLVVLAFGCVSFALEMEFSVWIHAGCVCVVMMLLLWQTSADSRSWASKYEGFKVSKGNFQPKHAVLRLVFILFVSVLLASSNMLAASVMSPSYSSGWMWILSISGIIAGFALMAILCLFLTGTLVVLDPRDRSLTYALQAVLRRTTGDVKRRENSKDFSALVIIRITLIVLTALTIHVSLQLLTPNSTLRSSTLLIVTNALLSVGVFLCAMLQLALGLWSIGGLVLAIVGVGVFGFVVYVMMKSKVPGDLWYRILAGVLIVVIEIAIATLSIMYCKFGTCNAVSWMSYGGQIVQMGLLAVIMYPALFTITDVDNRSGDIVGYADIARMALKYHECSNMVKLSHEDYHNNVTSADVKIDVFARASAPEVPAWVIITFPGSTSLKDWEHNIGFALGSDTICHNHRTQLHSGLAAGYQSLAPIVQPRIATLFQEFATNNHTDVRLILVGHSQGGAYAQLAGYHTTCIGHESFVPTPYVISFGSPRAFSNPKVLERALPVEHRRRFVVREERRFLRDDFVTLMPPGPICYHPSDDQLLITPGEQYSDEFELHVFGYFDTNWNCTEFDSNECTVCKEAGMAAHV